MFASTLETTESADLPNGNGHVDAAVGEMVRAKGSPLDTADAPSTEDAGD